MRQTYRVLALLVVLGVVVQAATIALAWFITINDLDAGLVLDEDNHDNIAHMMHGQIGGMVIPLIALILFIVSFFAKVPGGVKWAGFVLLAVIAQVVFAFFAYGVPAIGALHGINALVVGGVAGRAAMLAGRVTSAERSQPVAA